MRGGFGPVALTARRMHREPAVRDCGLHGHAIFLIAATDLSELVIDHGDGHATGVISLYRIHQL
jgi:hypothetical protein